MTENNGPGGQADDPGGLHILLVFLTDDRGTDGPGEHGPIGQTDDDDQQGYGQAIKTAQTEGHLEDGRH